MNTFQIAFLDGYLNKTASPLDDAAQEACPAPTEAQKREGNYRKGHLVYQGLPISIENPAGSTRSGTSSTGKRWTTRMHHHYGYIKGTTGFDKDHVDIFLRPEAGNHWMVYVVNQVDPSTQKFDEHKCMLGFRNKAEAEAAYLQNYQDGWQGLHSVVSIPLNKFKEWVTSSGPKRGLLK